jgi:hypothetical protein
MTSTSPLPAKSPRNDLRGVAGLAMSDVGELYIADTGNATIRKLAADGSLATIAGTPGVAGLFNRPVGSGLKLPSRHEQRRNPAYFSGHAVEAKRDVLAVAPFEFREQPCELGTVVPVSFCDGFVRHGRVWKSRVLGSTRLC